MSTPPDTHRLSYAGHRLACRPGETVLDALLRQGLPAAFSCKGGVCHACVLRRSDGPAPASAQHGLPERLRQRGYLLACQCRPDADMVLHPPELRDLRCECVLLTARAEASGLVRLRFTPARSLRYRPGDHLRLVVDEAPDQEPTLVLTSDPADGDWELEAVLQPLPGQPLPAWLAGGDGGGDGDGDGGGGDDAFGQTFQVWGPLELDDSPHTRARRPDGDLPPPATDPALWHELGDGSRVRALLEDFYAQVFADPLLHSFFAKTTPERAIGQQYSFMRQLMTGDRLYFGELPRNAHHWMVISDALMDHRQALMVATLRRHGLSAAQITRWTRLEEHWRRDMVKTAPFPKVLHGIEYPLEGFAREVLSSGALCDHCGAEVAAGTEVLYHLRLGQISCPACASGPQPA